MHNIQNKKYSETHANSLPDASNHCPSSFSAQIPKRPHSSTSLSMGMATVIMTVDLSVGSLASKKCQHSHFSPNSQKLPTGMHLKPLLMGARDTHINTIKHFVVPKKIKRFSQIQFPCFQLIKIAILCPGGTHSDEFGCMAP